MNRKWQVLALAAGLGVLGVFLSTRSTRALTISVLSAGKGDAVLIESPVPMRMLVDAGGDRSVLRALGETLPPWVRSLDAFIETAKVSAATGGEADVLSNYSVGRVLTQEDLHRGMRLDLGSGAYADVLYPDRNTSKMNPEDGAVVLRIVYGKTSFLIKENISSRADEYFDSLDGAMRNGEVIIASSTLPGTRFVSDGVRVKKE